MIDKNRSTTQAMQLYLLLSPTKTMLACIKAQWDAPIRREARAARLHSRALSARRGMESARFLRSSLLSPAALDTLEGPHSDPFRLRGARHADVAPRKPGPESRTFCTIITSTDHLIPRPAKFKSISQCSNIHQWDTFHLTGCQKRRHADGR